MKKNIGIIDKIIRILIAVVVFVLYSMGNISSIPGIILLALSILLILTSFIGICPLYLPFGISTAKKKAK